VTPSRDSVLLRELRQGRPFRSLEQEALLNILRTADALRHRLALVVAPEGITLQHYNVLRILRGAGPGGLPTLEIAQRMVERSPGITRLVDKLEALGLVQRNRPSDARRCVYCTITPQGLAALERLDQPVDSWTSRHLGRLGEQRLEAVIRILEDIRRELGPESIGSDAAGAEESPTPRGGDQPGTTDRKG
jgi:DNA-binding MarR family transcriptional regulator